jgi:pullulanase
MYKGPKNMKMAIQSNVKDLNNVGAFNDSFRDAIRGQGDGNSKGWLLGNLASANTIKSNLTFNYSNSYIGNSINYCEAHDNMTLWDKYQLSGYNGSMNEEQLRSSTVLGAGLVFTSQGTTFMHAGQEFLRTKEIDPSEETSEKVMSSDGQLAFNRNSYNSSDKLNSLKWNRVIENSDIVDAYKEMIKMRREQNIFHNSSMEGLDITLERGTDRKSLQMSLFNENANGWKEVKVIYNASSTDSLVYESPSSFKIGYQDGIYSANSESVTSVTVPLLSFVVLYY